MSSELIAMPKSNQEPIAATVKYLMALGACEDVAKLLGAEYMLGLRWHHFWIPGPERSLKDWIEQTGLEVDMVPFREPNGTWRIVVLLEARAPSPETPAAAP